MQLVLLFAIAVLSTASSTGQAADLAAFLPAPPPGWSARDGESVDGTAGSVEAVRVERIYTREDGATATVAIIKSPQAVMASRSAGMAFRNPQMIAMMNQNAAGEREYALIEQAGWSGWTVVEFDLKAEATGFSETVVLNVQIDRGDAQALRDFLEAIDWAGLAAIG